MRVSIGDVSLWFDVLSPGLVPDGPAMRAKPVLLGLHGGPGDDHSHLKGGVLERFCDLTQVVVYDHRGNGRSDDGDPALWTLDRWTDDVRAFCAALGIVRPILFGWSFGGFVAQAFASRYPDDLTGLILLATAPRLDFEQFGAAFARLGGPEAKEAARRVFTEPGSETEDDFFRLCLPLYSYRRDPEHLSNLLTRPVKRMEVMRRYFAGEAWKMDLRHDLARVTCPTLVVNGDYDPITPPVCSEEIVAALVNASVTHVVGHASAHWLPADEPDLFERTVREFIGQLDPEAC